MLDNFESHFIWDKKLGEGSFSHVFKVKDKRSGKFHAAKKLFRNYPTFEDTLDCAELKTLQKLEYHPNVLSIVDFVHDQREGQLILIFDLMDMSLYDFFKDRKRPLSEKRCKNYLYQMVLGLQHLHRSGIFHRDIKPENILIRQLKKNDSLHMELIQIADLGSVCSIGSKVHTPYISTRWYRSPECLLTCGEYGPKMDVWALGCVFYEILTLEALFPGDNELDQLHKIHEIVGTPSRKLLEKFTKRRDFVFVKKPAYPLHQLLPMVSSYGLDILKRTLNYHPDTRISSKQMVDHAYFDDLRSKYKSISSPGRYLMSTSLDEGINRRKIVSNCSSALSNSSRTSSIVRQLESMEAIKKSNLVAKKQLERVWGMNACPMKNEIMKKTKAATVKFE